MIHNTGPISFSSPSDEPSRSFESTFPPRDYSARTGELSPERPSQGIDPLLNAPASLKEANRDLMAKMINLIVIKDKP
jgi:hypothetical protein